MHHTTGSSSLETRDDGIAESSITRAVPEVGPDSVRCGGESGLGVSTDEGLMANHESPFVRPDKSLSPRVVEPASVPRRS